MNDVTVIIEVNASTREDAHALIDYVYSRRQLEVEAVRLRWQRESGAFESSKDHAFAQSSVNGSAVEDGATTPKLLYRVPEVAEALSISRSRVYELINKDVLKSVRLGRNIRVPTHELDRFIAELSEVC